MRRALVTAFAVIITGVGCAEEKATLDPYTPSTSAATAPGSIAMRLVGTDAQGRAYWLRSATFTITPSGGGLDAGAQGAMTVSSDDDPGADVLSVSLEPGSYDVTLQPGWYLEYQTPSGVLRAQNVRLASAATQPVAIAADQSAELTFRFTIDDTGRGRLDIGVDVETVRDAGGDAAVEVDASLPTEDASIADGGLDAGLEADAGEVDAGEADAGEADAGETDAGEADAGETDAGEADAGEDAGTDASTEPPPVLTAP